jgi:estrogen-related receptor beta like 1
MSSDQKYDDPVSMATNLLTEMKNCGIDLSISPNILRTGYGIPVCTVLLSLVNKALEKKGFKFKKPKFDEKNLGNSGDSPEIEDEAPDLINNEIDYGDNLNEVKKEEKAKTTDIKEDNTGIGILYSNTTQEDWQRELEKVSSKLKLDYNALNVFGKNEWRNHIQTIKDNEEKFTKEIPDSRAVLENLSTEIDRSLEKITKKEEILSKNHQGIISSYKERHKAGNNQIDEYKDLSENVELLKKECEDVNDKIQAAKEKYDSLSKKISDTSALANTKQAIANLQNETINMDMKINILNHSLLKYTFKSDLKGDKNDNNNVNDQSMYEEVL